MNGAFFGAWVLDGSPAGSAVSSSAREALRRAHGGRLDEMLEGPLWLAADGGVLARAGARRLAFSGLLAGGGDPLALCSDGAPPAGHFAFARADLERRTFALYRDPFGAVPLYYAETGGLLLFATSARILLASGLLPGGLDRETGLEAVLSADLAVLFGPRSLLAGVNELPPGRVMTASPSGTTTRDRVNPFVDNPGAREPLSPEVARRRLLDATRRAIGSGSRAAVALSGGVDSAAIASLAVELLGADAVEAFTYEFADASRPSEAPPAERVCRRLGIRHTVVTVDFASYARALPELFWRLEAPRLAPGAWIPFARALREGGFDRVLTGDGIELAFGIPGHLDLPEAIGRAVPRLPRPGLSLRYWRARRFHGWPLRRLARLLHPGFEPPNPHSYHMILCVLRHNGLLDDAAPFYPAGLQALARQAAESPRVAAAVREGLGPPLADQLRARRMSSFMLHRLFGGKHEAYRALGAVPVCPAYFMEDPPARPLLGALAGAELRRRALRRDVPEEVFARPKIENHSIVSAAWAARIATALAPLAPEAAARLAPPGPGRDALLRHYRRDLSLLGLWLRIFDAGPVPERPPTLSSLGLEHLFPEAA